MKYQVKNLGGTDPVTPEIPIRQCVRRLLCAIIIFTIRDAKRGDQEAISYLESEDCQEILFALGFPAKYKMIDLLPKLLNGEVLLQINQGDD